MLPFKEIPLSNGDARREPWPHRLAQIKVNAFKAEAIAEEAARVRTQAKAMGRDYPCRVSKYDQKTKRYVIDPVACEIQPNTAAIHNATREKWFEFCKEPQTPEDSIASVSPFKTKDTGANPKLAAVAVDDDPVTDRPRRGRPPGSKNRSSLAEV